MWNQIRSNDALLIIRDPKIANNKPKMVGKPKRSSPFRQIMVFYSEEVPTAEGSTPCVAGLHGEGLL